MSVFLLILKIIGIVLAGALALIILLAALVLFVPIRYKGAGKADRAGGRFTYEAYLRASWLLHILSAYASGDDVHGLNYGIKLLWIKLWPKAGKAAASKSAVTLTQTDEEITSETEVDSEPAAAISEQELADILSDEEEPDRDIQADDNPQPTETKKTFAERIKQKKDEAIARIRTVSDKVRYYYDMISDPVNQEAARFVEKRLKKLAGHIAPRRFEGHAHVGLSDPADTGALLAAYYAVVPPNKHFVLTGDFDEEALEGRLNLKGKIRLIYVLTFAIAIWNNKTVKSWIKQGE